MIIFSFILSAFVAMSPISAAVTYARLSNVSQFALNRLNNYITGPDDIDNERDTTNSNIISKT